MQDWLDRDSADKVRLEGGQTLKKETGTHTMKKRTDSKRSMQTDIKDKIITPRETKGNKGNTPMERERENKREEIG